MEQLLKQIDQSNASMKTDETQLEYTKIYAPVAGTVVKIDMNEGRTLNAVQSSPTLLPEPVMGFSHKINMGKRHFRICRVFSTARSPRLRSPRS